MPTDNLVFIRGPNPNLHNGEPVQDLIDKLEELLADARSGHLRAMATVCITSNRTIITCWNGSCDEHDMACWIAKLFHRYMGESIAQDLEADR